MGRAAEPASLNRYAYAEGNPVAYSDPTGHASWLKSALKTVLSAARGTSGKLTYNRLADVRLDPTARKTGQKASCFTAGLPTDGRGNVIAPTGPTWKQRQAAWAKSSAKSAARSSSRSAGGGGWGGTARSVRAQGRAATARATASVVQRAFCAGASFLGAADSSGNVDWGALGHAALDALGFVPGLGAAADVANGLWYLAEGNFADAGMSFLSAIPGVGDALGAGKAALKTGLAALDAADEALALARAAKKAGATGARPPNLAPEGAGRRGAFREAKRSEGIPVSQQPVSVKPAENRAGQSIPGRDYEFATPLPDGPSHTTTIREHYGHTYKDDPSQNRGPHFNDESGNHFDY